MADGLLLDLGENNTPVANNGEGEPLSVADDTVTTPESASPAEPAPRPLEFISREETPASPPVETPAANPPEPEKPTANGTHPLEDSPAAPATSSPTEEGSTISNQEDKQEEEKKKVEPQDPRLKEVEEKFGGKWKMVRSDPYDEYLKSLGVGFFSRKIAGRAYHEMELTIQDDNTIAVAMRSLLHSQNYVWKLDEEVENVVEKSRQGVVCTYENGKLVQQMTPLDPGSNKMQQVERAINDLGEHEVIFTAGEAVCRRYYARIPDPKASPAAAQNPPKEASTEEKDKEDKEVVKSTESQDKPAEQKEEITVQETVKEQTTETVTEQPAEPAEPAEQSSQLAEEIEEERPRAPSSSSA